MEFPDHLAHYNRYLWKSPNLIVVTGAAEKLWLGRSSYNQKYATAGAAGGEGLLKRLLAAAGLAAVSLSEREFWGWSVSLPGMRPGLFCGAEPEGMLCGRVIERNDEAEGLCVVQRKAAKTALAQSHFTIITQDPVEAVERYFEQAEQTLIRIAVDDLGRGVLLRPMPGGAFDAISGLSDTQLLDRIFSLVGQQQVQPLEEVLLFYGCPCSPEKMNAMLASLPADQQSGLWGDLERLEVPCPRCGRVYELTRPSGGHTH